MYPDQGHSPKTQESNGENGFWKFKVFIIENHLQKFNGKNFELSKTVFTIRFPSFWRISLAEVQKFSEISKKNFTILYKPVL